MYVCVCARPEQKEVGGVGGRGDAVMEADEESRFTA